jgi:preprotein translocase subunit SecG
MPNFEKIIAFFGDGNAFLSGLEYFLLILFFVGVLVLVYMLPNSPEPKSHPDCEKCKADERKRNPL